MNREYHVLPPLEREAVALPRFPVDFFPPKSDSVGSAKSGLPQEDERE
jgi:hypothetical protein